jgi:hypothetical protein
MSKILHITHPEFNFSTINSNSKLLTSVIPDLPHNEYHTSLGDLSSKEVISVAPSFDTINFYQEHFDKKTDNLYKETVVLLNYLQNFKPVIGFSREPVIDFTNHPGIYDRSDTPVLWVFGCSHSYGVGLRNNELCYGKILSQELELPLKLIAKPGSSLHWSLRHLMNSNIRVGDTVIWQLTTPSRVSVFNGNHVEEILLARTSNRHLLEINTDHQIYFNHLTLLKFGVQYLRAKNVNFRLTSIEDRPETNFRNEYSKYPEYCYAPGFNIDIGIDGLHYGPLSHKNLAFRLIDHLQCKNVYTI